MGLDTLPTEILCQIFSYISSNREDIAACRLVCKSVNTCSSEFLITRVVFAHRLKTLQHLWEVLEHPYFCKYVTELVYDASLYHKEVVDWSPLYHSLNRVKYKTAPNYEKAEEWQDFYGQVYQCSQKDWDRFSLFYNSGELRYRLAIRKSFLDYCERWHIQEWIIDDGLGLRILQQVFLRLPKLRRIVVSDFRELAMAGEEWEDLCNRFFDTTLEPSISLGGVEKALLAISEVVLKTPQACIQDLSIGGRDYESFGKLQRQFHPDEYADHAEWIDFEINPFFFGKPALFCQEDGPFTAGKADGPFTASKADGICGKLLQLHLRVMFAPDTEGIAEPFDDNAGKCKRLPALDLMLKASARSLVKLSLCASDLVFKFIDSEADDNRITFRGTACLEATLFRITFRSLQHLELKGWPLPRDEKCERFLSRHSSTLRELRLLDCVTFEDPKCLGRWGGGNMSLNGIQIDHLAKSKGIHDCAKLYLWNERDLEALWLAGRPNLLDSPERVHHWSFWSNRFVLE